MRQIVAMKAKPAILKESVSLLGTSLKIKGGSRVIAMPAMNQPDKTQFFIRPPFGKWQDGIRRGIQDSILVSRDELEFVK